MNTLDWLFTWLFAFSPLIGFLVGLIMAEFEKD